VQKKKTSKLGSKIVLGRKLHAFDLEPDKCLRELKNKKTSSA